MLEGTCHCGAVRWTFEGAPDSATACNCTLCRRYGVLWIYGHEGEGIAVNGPTTVYLRPDGGALEFHFCTICGCVVCWRAARTGDDGRRRMAVNIRLADAGTVAHLPIDHFDGLVAFDDLPRDGRCVRDLWF